MVSYRCVWVSKKVLSSVKKAWFLDILHWFPMAVSGFIITFAVKRESGKDTKDNTTKKFPPL